MKNTLRAIMFSVSKMLSPQYKKFSFLFLFGFMLLIGNVSNAQVTIISDDFEAGFGNWNDGGGDCERNNNTLLGGNWNIRLRDNSGVASSMTSDAVNFAPYDQVNITFDFHFQGFENGESFFIQYFSGGPNYTLATYTVGAGYNNNTDYSATITIPASTFVMGASSLIRIRSNASNNNDEVHIDNVNVIGYTTPSNDECANAISLTPDLVCNPTTGTTIAATQSLSGCSGTADDDVWYSFVATNTEHTVTVEASTISDIVFEVFDSCGGSSLVCEDSTFGSSTESATLTGLTAGVTYYVRVYSWSSNASNQGEFSICITEPCIPSTANGTSALACPSVGVGGIDVTGGVASVSCSVSNTVLEASYLELGETSSYAVEAIPYSPPFQFSCLANPVSVSQDDVFSPVVNLPFDFCFYGNTYNSCVIGSNGIISFDTSLANGNSGWRILQNIPSTINATDFDGPSSAPRRDYFFGPSIYGVHHDVDPSIGGEIGWQLITLNTGCQALVAAWSDVPMFSDNSILYSGMMVFYEDTNVIEIYIKEKNVISTWNSGNATVGLQASATEATVAPLRNSLQPNWNVTQEAWRFTPDGTSITSLKWYENSISAANEIIDPNDDGEITVAPTSSTDYFAEVTYSLCNGSTIVETDQVTVSFTGDKIWNGSVSSDWSDDNNWTPIGVPTIANCITIPITGNNPIMSGTTDGYGLNIEILDGALLTQQSNASLTIDEEITIETNGDFEVRDSASVIQVTDVTTNQNTGSTRVQREVLGVGYFDYVYWSSPVDAFNVEDISPGTPNFAIWEWTPTVVNGTAGNHGTWINTLGNMNLGKGYIVRGLLGGSIANTAEFTGTLNNGQISVPISRGGYNGADYAGIGNTATADDDNWNLLGNPYPSAISLNDFVAANPDIDGTLYFWRHLTPINTGIANPFYENYTYNYTSSDYLSENNSGSVPMGLDDGLIASGQGFFALMLDSAPTSSTVTFSNTMRGLYANDEFYRNASSTNTEEKHRIWLDLVNESDNTANSILVGYIDGATDELDRLFDGHLLSGSGHQFYSLISDQELVINGKGLPFEDTDTMPLGYKALTPGSFAISINSLDGLFDSTDQNIFIEDTELNIIHDLRVNPYSFTTNQGIFNERFILRFNSSTLSIKDEEILSGVDIRTIDNTIEATSSLSNIETFELYDIRGRLIHSDLKVNSTNYSYQANELSHGPYFVKVSLSNGASTSKKLIL